MDLIKERRSIRKFSSRSVERESVIEMLKAAMQAPSAANQQPWEFVVVQDKGRLELLSGMSPYAKMTAQAAGAVIFIGNQKRFTNPDMWQQDMGAATQNFLLKAVELGLGAVWLGVSPKADREEYIRNHFGLDNEAIPFCVIPYGYPAEGQGNRFIDRFDPERIRFDGA